MTDYLMHYGVKGMKWGIRKDSNESYTLKTKNGEIMTMQRDTGGLLAKSLRRLSPKIRTEAGKTYYYKLKNANNKTVGNLQLYKKNSDEMNVTWGSVNKKHQGKGYMSAMIEQGEEISRLYGAKKLTAEIVMNSPDMLLQI